MKTSHSTTIPSLIRQNLRKIKEVYPEIDRSALAAIREITVSFGLSVSRGEMMILDGKFYVTHAGLLRLAQRRQCVGITTSLQRHLSDMGARIERINSDTAHDG